MQCSIRNFVDCAALDEATAIISEIEKPRDDGERLANEAKLRVIASDHLFVFVVKSPNVNSADARPIQISTLTALSTLKVEPKSAMSPEHYGSHPLFKVPFYCRCRHARRSQVPYPP